MPVRPWGDYFLHLASVASTQSKDTTKVGAALIGPDREVRLLAYNGPPRGVKDKPERFERANGEKYRWISHAEQNLVAFAAREGVATKGCTVAVSHFPCSACARSLIQAGVISIIVGDGTTSMPKEEFDAAEQMFEEAGVQIMRSKTRSAKE
jgi:dCMP deaminase